MIVIGCRSTSRVASLRYSAGDGGCVRVVARAARRIVEGPVLDFALPALHHHAAHLRRSSAL